MTRSISECIEIVQKNVDRRALLEGLAEEAAELAQAALKAIRAEELNGNVTPVSAEEANQKLIEEIGDVNCIVDVLGVALLDIDCASYCKMQRWANRLSPEAENDRENIVPVSDK